MWALKRKKISSNIVSFNKPSHLFKYLKIFNGRQSFESIYEKNNVHNKLSKFRYVLTLYRLDLIKYT